MEVVISIRSLYLGIQQVWSLFDTRALESKLCLPVIVSKADHG